MNYYKERFWDDGDMVLVEGDDGEWCRRDDVDAALAALRAELAQARAEQRRDAGDGQGALDEANGEIERLRAELAAMTARAKQAERELRLLADVLTKHETGGPA